MERKYITANTQERERLKKLVSELSDKELKLVIYKEGWTIAAVLGHVAFWDERRLALVKKWRQNGVTPPGMNDLDTDVINDALVPFLLAIPPRKVAEMAIRAAETLDNILETISPELITAINALGDRHALDRSIHRRMHLDEIETFLKSKRRTR